MSPNTKRFEMNTPINIISFILHLLESIILLKFLFYL